MCAIGSPLRPKSISLSELKDKEFLGSEAAHLSNPQSAGSLVSGVPAIKRNISDSLDMET